jgi:hypothetical protein
MIRTIVCCGLILPIGGFIGCGGGDDVPPASDSPSLAPTVTGRTDDPPAMDPDPASQEGAFANDSADQSESQNPDGFPAWIDKEADAPFDVRQYLESRAAPADNAAPLYLEVLGSNPTLREVIAPSLEDMSSTDPSLLQKAERSLESVASILKQIDLAQTKPECVFVREFDVTIMLEDAQSARSVVRASLLQMYLARAKGDAALAESAIRRALRLSRDIQPRGLLVHMFHEEFPPDACPQRNCKRSPSLSERGVFRCFRGLPD